MSYCLYYIFASFTSELPWETCGNWSLPKYGNQMFIKMKSIAIIERLIFRYHSCVVRTDNTSTCDNSTMQCQSASEQYWERSVLGLHRAPKQQIIEPFNETEGADDVNRTYVLWNFGEIGEIKWDLRWVWKGDCPV